jgi:predicted kinase
MQLKRLISELKARAEQQRLFLIPVGAPGCGKSTLVQELRLAGVDMHMHGNDQVLEEQMIIQKYSYDEAFKKVSASYIKNTVRSRVQEAIKAGQHTGIDQTHMSAKTRKHHLSFLDFAQTPYLPVAVIFDVPTATLLERCRKREALTGKHIPEFVVHNMLKNYQPVLKAEGFREIFTLD